MKTENQRYVMFVEELITTLEGLVVGLGGNRKKALDLNFKILKEEVDNLEGLIHFFRNENKDIPKKVKENLVDNFSIGCKVEPKDEIEADHMNVPVGTKAIVEKNNGTHLRVKWPQGTFSPKEWQSYHFKVSEPKLNDCFPIGCEVEPASVEEAFNMNVPVGTRAIVESFEKDDMIIVKWLGGANSCKGGWYTSRYTSRFKRVCPKSDKIL